MENEIWKAGPRRSNDIRRLPFEDKDPFHECFVRHRLRIISPNSRSQLHRSSIERDRAAHSVNSRGMQTLNALFGVAYVREHLKSRTSIGQPWATATPSPGASLFKCPVRNCSTHPGSRNSVWFTGVSDQQAHSQDCAIYG
jgi:hypothetical protein